MTTAVKPSMSGDLAADAVTLDLVRDRLVGLGRQYTPADVASAMRAEGLAVSDSAVLDAMESLRRHSVGAGPLEPLLREPGVTDVLVNGPDQVFIDRGAGLELTGVRFLSDSDVRRLGQRLAASVGRRLDDAAPFVDARLADGTRVHAVLGCLASPGTCISLRVPAQRSFSIEDCVTAGSLTPGAAHLLSRMIKAKLAFLISGGTGSGNPTRGLPHTISRPRQEMGPPRQGLDRKGPGLVQVNHPRQRTSEQLRDHDRATEPGRHAACHLGHLASAASAIAPVRFNPVASDMAKLFARAATALTQIRRDRRSLSEDEPR